MAIITARTRSVIIRDRVENASVLDGPEWPGPFQPTSVEVTTYAGEPNRLTLHGVYVQGGPDTYQWMWSRTLGRWESTRSVPLPEWVRTWAECRLSFGNLAEHVTVPE